MDVGRLHDGGHFVKPKHGQDGYFKVPNRLIEILPHLSRGELNLILIMLQAQNTSNEQVNFLKQANLCKMLACSRRTVKRTIASLKKTGLLRTINEAVGTRRARRRIVFSDDPVDKIVTTKG